jgi:uncharacterized membrane protein
VHINIKDNAWADILNIHYGASISLVFALTIIAQGADKPGQFLLSVADDPLSFGTFVLLVAYIFVDCITANARQGSHRQNVLFMMASLLWIWFLGVCAIYAKSPEATKYILIPAYFVFSKGFQLFAYVFDFFEVKPERKFAILLVTIIALVCSLVMLPTCVYAVWLSANKEKPGLEALDLDPNFIMTVLSGALLVLKYLEIQWVAGIKNHDSSYLTEPNS